MGSIHEKKQRPKISCYCTYKGNDLTQVVNHRYKDAQPDSVPVSKMIKET
jgi:hypothetical protein